MSTVVRITDAIGSRMSYEYLKRKICLTKIAPHSKRPVEKDWQTRYYNDIEHASAFVDHNIGLILGTASNYLTDIDLDCDEAIALAPYILPRTTWVFGRASARRSHYLYHCKDSKTTKFASPTKDGGMLLEIRSDGAQTVAPGSIHPSGEAIQFHDPTWKQYRAAEVADDDLRQRCGDLAAACLVLRHGWADGKRDELAVALCGMMLRMNRDPDYIDQWLGAIARVADDEELDMRLKAEYQQKRLTKGERVPGIPSLMNILGPDIGARVVDWLGIKSLNVVNEFNNEIGIISMGDKTRVVVDGGYWNQGQPRFLKINDARDLYRSRGMVAEKNPNNPKARSKETLKFDIWLNSGERRNYSSLVFAPDGCKENEYNLWKGWPIAAKEDNPKGCSLFLKHVKEVICDGRADLYDYVITWMADAIQNITTRPGVALVLQGSQGTGKTMFADYFLKLYGKYGLTSTNSDHLFGKHNFHLANKLVVFADESCWAGNRHHASILNNFITADVMGYEPKGVDQVHLDNHMRMIMATNDAWAAPASGIARRFCILEVSDKKQGDREYFEKLAFEMENDGPESLLAYLKNYKIRLNLKNIPETDAIRKNKILTVMSTNPVLGWWITRLTEETPTKHHDDWDGVISIAELHRDYSTTFSLKIDRSSLISFSMIFKGLLPVDMVVVKKRVQGKCRKFYRLPDLNLCKEYVATHLMKEPNLFNDGVID
jgi:hypothetical protein